MKLVLFILVFLSFSAQAERYAVIVNGGDDGLLNSNTPWLKESTEKIYEQYRSRGYKVIVIEAEKKEGSQTFKDRLAEFKNVESLDLAFLGHGAVLNAGVTTSSGEKLDSELKRFPYSHLRPDETERADVENLNSDIHFGYVMVPAGDEQSDWRKWIGMGDLHGAVSKLKYANPKMQTTIRSLNCFGGNAIRAMESIPDVQVYSSSSAFHSAISLSKGDVFSFTTTDFMSLFTQELETGKTYGEADVVAKKKFLNNQLNYLDVAAAKSFSSFDSFFAIPLSSMESHFKDECLGKPRAMDLIFCQNPPEKNEAQLLSRQVAQTMVIPTILEHIDLEKRYLESLKSHGFCNGDSITLPLSLVEKGRDAIKKLAQTSEGSLESYLKGQISQISSANTLDEFQQFDADRAVSFLLPFEKDNPKIVADRLEILPLFKKNEIDKRKRLLEKWQNDKFKQDLKDKMSKLSEGEQDKKCVADLAACDISELVAEWSEYLQDYPIKPANLLSKYSSAGESILEEKCPALISPTRNVNALKLQLDCIYKLSKKSPLEALVALNGLRKSREGDNSKLCARIKKEETLLEKVEICAKNSSKIESDTFWTYMLSLKR